MNNESEINVLPLSTQKLILRRVVNDWPSMSSIFLGIIVVSVLVTAAPVYLRSLERLALNLEIDTLGRPYHNLTAYVPNVPLSAEALERSEHLVTNAIDEHLSPIYDRHERYLAVADFLAWRPSNELPPGGQRSLFSRAYFRHFTNIEKHLTIVEGRLAGPEVKVGPEGGPIIEGIISTASANEFKLDVGDTVRVAPHLGSTMRISVRVSGIVEAADPTEDYWKPHSSVFLDPPTVQPDPEAGVLDFDPSQPPVPLFIAENTMVEVVGGSYPSTLIDAFWFIMVETENLKEWSLQEALQRMVGFDRELGQGLAGAEVFSGIEGLLNQFDAKVFFSRVPLLFLLLIVIVALLFFLAMMVSYLVSGRDDDFSLLKARGVSVPHAMQLYGLEGVAIVTVAVLLAIPLAFGLVAVSGTLPYFNKMTGGELLPVVLEPRPFVAASVSGLAALVIYMLPVMFGRKGGLLESRRRFYSPPSVFLVQRYYVDVALLVLGGLVFWELSSRGHFIAGGLLKDVEINEILVLAPALFLIVVTMLFMRVFPLIARFFAGESPAVLHLLFGGSLLALGISILVREINDGSGLSWLVPTALLVGACLGYWVTHVVVQLRFVLAGLVLQAIFVTWFLYLEQPRPDEVLFLPSLGLFSVLPGQVIFQLLRYSDRAFPVWVSLGLWHLARAPLQYTWLTMLLILVTAVSVLATTVGGTLGRNQEDRVNYDVGADLRVSINESIPGAADFLKELYSNILGVASVSPALRMEAGLGPEFVTLLALDSQEFQYISWYREDFSAKPLDEVMRALQHHPQVERIEIPEHSTMVGIWAKPEEEYPGVSMWMTLQDSMGTITQISLGQLGGADWNLMTAEIPRSLRPPLFLVSLQLFESALGSRGTPGALLLDDIHVFRGPKSEKHQLEDFEEDGVFDGRFAWMPILTTSLTLDRIDTTSRDAYEGVMSGLFSFGSETAGGTRGFYQSPTGGPLPIIVSAGFAERTESEVGDYLVALISGRRVFVVIRDVVQYFPTMKMNGMSFMLADVNDLLGHLNILTFRNALGLPDSIEPNELFITEVPDARGSVREAMVAMGDFPVRVHDRAAALDTIKRDPLSTAGWKSMVILSIGITVMSALLGYVTYFLASARRRNAEIGFLSSLGVSGRQLMGFLVLEHVVVGVVGLGFGSWVGFYMTKLIVSPLVVTERADIIMPPLILTTNWWLMAPTYAVLLGMLGVVLLLMSRGIKQVSLHTITRMKEH